MNFRPRPRRDEPSRKAWIDTQYGSGADGPQLVGANGRSYSLHVHQATGMVAAQCRRPPRQRAGADCAKKELSLSGSTRITCRVSALTHGGKSKRGVANEPRPTSTAERDTATRLPMNTWGLTGKADTDGATRQRRRGCRTPTHAMER